MKSRDRIVVQSHKRKEKFRAKAPNKKGDMWWVVSGVVKDSLLFLHPTPDTLLPRPLRLCAFAGDAFVLIIIHRIFKLNH
jgi:hypothetical protein